jgi:hypothetical protein
LAKAGDVIIFPGVRYEQDRAASQADRAALKDGASGGGGNEPRH